MTLTAIKEILRQNDRLMFELPDGNLIPEYFHVTEIGDISKKFIDCGGTVRNENKINFQLWVNHADSSHRLQSQKLLDIISLSEKTLGIQDAEIEVEYQVDTIGKYGLEFNGQNFVLTNTQTACLANELCGVPQNKIKKNLAALNTVNACCSSNTNCC